jgi:hypothetical protein
MPNSPKYVIATVAWLKTRGQKRHARFSIYYDFFSINKIASPACHHQWGPSQENKELIILSSEKRKNSRTTFLNLSSSQAPCQEYLAGFDSGLAVFFNIMIVF